VYFKGSERGLKVVLLLCQLPILGWDTVENCSIAQLSSGNFSRSRFIDINFIKYLIIDIIVIRKIEHAIAVVQALLAHAGAQVNRCRETQLRAYSFIVIIGTSKEGPDSQ